MSRFSFAFPRVRFASATSAALLFVVGAMAHAQVLRERDVGSTASEEFGIGCANVGDVDGDGVDDFIVGGQNYCTAPFNDVGRVVVYSGATGAVIREHDGNTYIDQMGARVAGVGDVDGDGCPDYACGVPSHVAYWIEAGEVVVYSGRNGQTIWSAVGSSANEGLGLAVAGVGDIDGDGMADVIASNLNSEVFVYGANGSVIRQITGGYSFGEAVASAGDCDGDGVPDLLVSAPYENWKVPHYQDCGVVHVYSGASGAHLHYIHGDHDYDHLGRVLVPIGDLDHDGVREFIAGSSDSNANGPYSGLVRVVNGATGATIFEQPGDGAYDGNGTAVVGLGDVDRDGVADYAVGAIGSAPLTGRVRICSGASGATIYEWIGDASHYEFGCALAAGDWNGDGVLDLVIGDLFGMDSAGNNYGSAEVWLVCPAWSASYGAGWPGRNGIPTLTAQEKPVVGAPLDLDLSNSLGAPTSALLFIGVQTENVPLHNSGTLLVAPLLTVVVPVPAGGLTLSGALPNDPSLYFFDLYLQALEVDSFASKGFSFTPGLQLHCGFDLP